MKVKVCGITNLEDALMCENYGADALGFIFYKESKRYIEPENAKNIIEKLSPFTLKIGVFVNESFKVVNELANYTNLNAVQLHGDESQKLFNSINLPVIKSFRINDEFDFSFLFEYKSCNYLLDSYSDNHYGGTGNNFNWDLIPKEIKNKIILSGGVSSNNIEQIIKEVKPMAIDISSSLEEIPGKKDKNKTDEFFTLLNKIRYRKC